MNKPAHFLPILDPAITSFKSDAHKRKILKSLYEHPDSDLFQTLIERLKYDSDMGFEMFGHTPLQGKKSELRISQRVLDMVNLLEACNFIRLISIIYQSNPDMKLSLRTPGNPQSPDPLNFTNSIADRVAAGLAEYVLGSPYLTTNGVDQSEIVFIGDNEFTPLLSEWGNKGKVFLDKQGFGYIIESSYGKPENHFDRTKNRENLHREISQLMVYLLSDILVPKGSAVSKEADQTSRDIYNKISNSAQKHILVHKTSQLMPAKRKVQADVL